MHSRLSSATKWFSATASRLFSSSSSDSLDSVQSEPVHQSQSQLSLKRGRGRPKKDPKGKSEARTNGPPIHHGRMRASRLSRSSTTSVTGCADEEGPCDGQVRYLLTLKVLPDHLRIIAATLHPQPRNRFEEHRLVCKLMNEESLEINSKRREIAIPTYKRLSGFRSKNDGEKGIHEKENVSEEDFLHRHRPLELAERRERRREEEMVRYELYIRKLSREYPELQNRKYSFTESSVSGSGSSSKGSIY